MSNETDNGFFVRLGLDVAKETFEGGKKAISGIGNSVTMLLGTVRNAVPLITAGIAGIALTSQQVSLNASGALGFSTKQYEAWGLAANKAGVNAQNLFSKMKELEGIKYEILEYGSSGAAEGLGLNLSQLGINDLNEFLSMDPQSKVQAVFDAAHALVEGGDEWQDAAYKLGKVLGSDFQTIFEKSYTEPGFNFMGWINSYYQLANDTDTQLKKLGLKREASDMAAFFKTMKEFSDGEFAQALTPMFKSLNEFFSLNKDDIKNMITEVANALGVLSESITPTLIGLLNDMTPAVSALAKALGDLINKNWESAAKNLEMFFNAMGHSIGRLFGAEESKPGESQSESLSRQAEAAYNDAIDPSSGKNIAERLGLLLKGVGLAGGALISSDEIDKAKEQVRIQFDKDLKEYGNVANFPDEKIKSYFEFLNEGWLNDYTRERLSNPDKFKFYEAAMKIGDYQQALKIAKFNSDKKKTEEAMNAIMTQSNAAQRDAVEKAKKGKHAFLNNNSLLQLAGINKFSTGAASAVINQTITVNGSADVAFDVKQQAYRGAQEGLSQAMNVAQVRMQLTPGFV